MVPSIRSVYETVEIRSCSIGSELKLMYGGGVAGLRKEILASSGNDIASTEIRRET
jgi:hypothetical protein